MPMNAIVLPAGSGTGNTLERMSAVTAIIPPVSSEAGRTTLWTEVPVIARAI